MVPHCGQGRDLSGVNFNFGTPERPTPVQQGKMTVSRNCLHSLMEGQRGAI